MKQVEIALLRLKNQQLLGTGFQAPGDLLTYMGVMQAQDFAMSKWALGVRLPSSTEASIDRELSDGNLLRTHVLRPTWHLVSPNDIHWMLKLSAPRIKTSMRSGDKALGLDEEIFSKSNRIIEKALSKGEHLTRDVLVDELRKAGLTIEKNIPAHLLMRAEIEGIICSGRLKNGKNTYALLAERAPEIKFFSKEESLAELAARYFRSHGPATLADFVWWSGLTVKEAREGLNLLKDCFQSAVVDDLEYWFQAEDDLPDIGSGLTHFLPAFDEYLVSYRNRLAALPAINHHRAVFVNGLFRPIIVLNGQVVGIWKRTLKKEQWRLEAELFKPDEKLLERLKPAAASLVQFSGREAKWL